MGADATMPVGTRDSVLGRSYVQIAREGWGQQKSQNGGANPTLTGPATTSYHLWAVVPREPGARAKARRRAACFTTRKVDIDTSIVGMGRLAGNGAPAWIAEGLRGMDAGLRQVVKDRDGKAAAENAHALAALYKQTLDLRERVGGEVKLTATAKAGLLFELDAKIDEFQGALKELLGLDVVAFRTKDQASRRALGHGAGRRMKRHGAYARRGVQACGCTFRAQMQSRS